MTQNGTSAPAENVDGLRADLEEQLEDAERTLSALQRSSERFQRLSEQATRRARVLPALTTTEAPAPPAEDDEPLRIDSPVFEAAVLDIVERAEDTRDEMRAAARDDKRRRRDEYWANELTQQLGLAPAQTERLLAIRAQLEKDLEQIRSEDADGRYVPRAERRAARTSARQGADEQLRAVFTRQQVAAYEALDKEFKLYRPRNSE